ncbi:MAG: amidohydrolase family protein [Verrucomicrobia bacterium]|nr:amidohydrolase family protein [Verrucomicrobiota bacterium]
MEAETNTRPSVGIRSHTPNFHALTGLRIVTKPGELIDLGTIVIKHGVITSVSIGNTVPDGCRVWDFSGKTAYAGFIDSFSEARESVAHSGGDRYWNPHIRPARSVGNFKEGGESLNVSLRKQGVLLRLVAPKEGVIKGQSILVSTGSGKLSDRLVSASAAMHVRLTVPFNRERDDYPNSPMGAVALARQAMYDTEWYGRAWKVFRNRTGLPKPELNRSLAALGEIVGSGRLFIAESSNEEALLRADRFGREFGLPLAILGSGWEYRRLDAVRATGRSVIVPVDFPKPPDVSTAESAAEVSLKELMDWELAPENPGRMDAAGIQISLTSNGLKDRSQFIKQVRMAVRRGLGAESALAALTTRPAALLGVESNYGTLENGKIANLIIADGDVFGESTRIDEVWIAGERHPLVANASSTQLEGEWRVTMSEPKSALQKQTRLVFKGVGQKLSGRLEIGAKLEKKSLDASKASQSSFDLTQVRFASGRLGAQFSGQVWRDQTSKETVRLSATYLASDVPLLVGKLIRVDGREYSFEASLDRNQSEDIAEEKDESSDRDSSEKGELVQINYPLGAFGLKTEPPQPEVLLIENVTIWTCGAAGVIEGGAILIENGIIKEVGKEIAAPSGAIRIDGRGRHLTPGIIDCHSHMATDGGINESTQAITAEVRIGDFIDANDINIYRQLAGGVTTANILHGSANPIGGQNQVIKLRWGAIADELLFDEAPPGIKFALGENVKHSNRGDDYTTRYPQTRMGVEQIMRDAFNSARSYGESLASWEWAHEGLPPRRDLEQEAILEIVNGERWIHCHSYRQDEILALIRTLDSFGIRIGTFQHILEGYKVAPEMKRHGAMASGFSDWWAYKVEVFDAIPYNGALMHEAGIVVSFNSDDRELARRLNLEAAKAVKYGGVSPEEALKFVTLNPAKQLRIDSYVGSLESGKQADFVLWNGSPLSNLSRCEQTWIDGRCYFSLEKDQELREEAKALRDRLIRKILESGKEMVKPGEKKVDETALWPRDDLFCFPHHRGNHGHDGDVHFH